MATSTVQPGLQAVFASPYTPIGTINGTPIYRIGGARGGGVQIVVDDSDGDDLGDEDDDDDDEEDEPEADPQARRRTTRRGQPQDDDGEADGDAEPDERDAVLGRMETALRKANREAATRRTFGKSMKKLGIEDGNLDSWLIERGIDPETGDPIGDGPLHPVGEDEQGDDPGDSGDPYEEYREAPQLSRRDQLKADRAVVQQVMKAERRGEQKALERLTPILAQQAAEAALRAAHFNGDAEKLAMALRFIDPAQIDVEIDDEGYDVVGIDEQVAELQEQFPELFRTKETPARRASRAAGAGGRARGARDVDGGDRGRQPQAPRTWAEKMADQLAKGR